MENFRQSKIWESCRLLILEAYHLTDNFPGSGDLGFKNKIRRFAVLTSGYVVRVMQEKDPDLCSQFLENAESCMNELDSTLKTAFEKGYLQGSINQTVLREIFEIRKSLKAIQQPEN